MKDEKVSKAQLDVWKSKEKLYNEVKDMSSEDALKYLVNKGEHTAKTIGLKSKKNVKVSS